MNLKELNQLIESNTDLTQEQQSALYDLFLSESAEIFNYAHQVTQDSGDPSEGVDVLVGAYNDWVSRQHTYDALNDAFVNRTIDDMTENFWGALT